MLALYLVAGVALARSAAGQEAVNVAENATVTVVTKAQSVPDAVATARVVSLPAYTSSV